MSDAWQRFLTCLKADLAANERALPLDRPLILEFLRLLRLEELLDVGGPSPWRRAFLAPIRRRRHALGLRLGFVIPPHVFGPGLGLPHIGSIVVNERARIGAGCRVHVGVNIGAYEGGSPVIGDNVYLGPGAKLFGSIRVADHIRVGANAVVNRSFEEPGITIAGVPARQVSGRAHVGLGRGASYESRE